MEDVIAASHSKLYTIKTDPMIRLLTALGTFRYQGRHSAAAAKTLDSWYLECSRLISRRVYSLKQCSSLLQSLANLPRPGIPGYLDSAFIARILRSTRTRNASNASASSLASLARSLRILGHQPDFGFMHSFTQAARYMWTGFKPQVGREGRRGGA